ncbi:MAG: DUF6569 family protein [Actinomycetota bacterium]
MTDTAIPITDLIQLGDPVAHRGIVVAPLFPRVTPRAVYASLDQAIAAGMEVREVDAAGSVGQLTVHNPTGAPVLLYDGEELLGAKQNRVLNVTVLVPPHSELLIPVSYVEQGRWSADAAAFRDSGHTAYPELRRRKAQALAAGPLDPGRGQGEVWQDIAEKSTRVGHRSPTGAHADMHRALAPRVDELAAAFPAQPGQCGAVLALDGRVTCLDAVSRPDAFARLSPKLLRGYMLDAVEAVDRAAAPRDAITAFVAAVGETAVTRRPSVGLGDDLRLHGAATIGSGLMLDGELIQVCAYPSDGREDGPAAAGGLRRPSARRRTA